MSDSFANTHPSRELLRRFGGGMLHDPEMAAIKGHLETCAVCSQMLLEQTQPPQQNDDRTVPPKLDHHVAVAMHSGQEETCAQPPVTSSPGKQLGNDLPERVGRYHLEREIARGGMGQVVRVTDEVFQRPLAMKIALGCDQMSQDAQERFIREARVTGQLQHPGIPPVQEMGKLEDGRPYFIMKLIQGSDLKDLLRNRRVGDDLPRFVAIFQQICQTLGYAHSQGIIHRDLKPANIMVGAFGEVQVMDWGLAKVLRDEGKGMRDEGNAAIPSDSSLVPHPSSLTTGPPQETAAGTVMGTSAYMAPEQARGEVDTLDARCDVFGLGGILCEILTGAPPFAEQTSMQNVVLAMLGDLSSVTGRLNACGADAELVDLAKRCLAADRNDRPGHGGVVAEAVAQYQAALLERMQQAEIDKAAALVKMREERKRRRVSLALAAAVVLLIVGGSAGALWYQGERARQDAARIQQDEDRRRQEAEVRLRREYLNKEVAHAVADAESRRKDLLRRLANQGPLNELLSDIGLWRQALNDAQAAALYARKSADGSPELVEAALAERLRMLEVDLAGDEKDWKFGKACDDARLAAATNVDGTWDPQAAARMYAKIFAGAGLDVLKGDPDSIAVQIKQSPIRLVHVAALAHWADVSRKDIKLLAQLFAIANKVDADPWRTEYRNVKLSGKKFQETADKVDVQKQSPQLLLSLALGLGKVDGAKLLRQAQRDHPRDFWILFGLGGLSTDPAEQEGCFRAALAIRPLSGPAHVNLGRALGDKKEMGSAIWHYRKALDLNPKLVEAHINLGAALNKKNEVDEAIKHYRTALGIDPNSAMAHSNLGVALHRKKDVEAAIKHYDKALEISPDSAVAHLNLSSALLAKKDLDGALEHSRTALKIDPNLAEAHVNLGRALEDKKDDEGALRHFLKAIDIKPNLPEAYLNLGRVLRRQKNVEGAIKYYRKFLDFNPDNAHAHHGLGLVLRDKKDEAGAVKHLSKAVDLDPDNADAHYALGLALSAQKDADGAIRQFRKTIGLGSDNALAHYSLGIELHNKNDLKGAVEHYRKAIDIDPNYAPAHNNLGNVLSAQKDKAGAIKHYRKAIDIDDNFALAHMNLGARLAENKELDEAIKHFRKAISLEPGDPKMLANLGTALLAKKEVDEAIKYFRLAEAADPGLVDIHISLGNAYSAKKDAEAAIPHYRKAVDLNPNHAHACYHLGHALHNKDKVEAIRLYRKAIEATPNHADAHYQLGHALSSQKDAQGAIQHFRKAVESNPNHAEAHANLGAALLARNDVETAVEHFHKAIDINNNAQAHSGLGTVYYARKDMKAAIQHFRKAIEANPDYAEAHSNLGGALHAVKDLEPAIEHLRKALAINPNHAGARFNLVVVSGTLSQKLLGAGQFDEARTVTLEWLKLLSAEHPQRKTAQERLKRLDGLLALDKQLLLILNGEAPPNEASELLALAELCMQYKQDYVAATRFFAAALTKQPKLVDGVQNHLLYDSARAASLAGAGKGKNADKLADHDRSKFRRQAFDWLRADLTRRRKQSQSGNVEELLLLTEKLTHWQRDPALAGIRDAKELAGLPEEDRQPWQQLWADHAQLLKEIRARFVHTQHQGTLTAKQMERVHEVKMVAGKSYVFDLESAQFDAYLRLEDAKGKILAENDDISPEDQNSRLVFFPKEPGVYRIVATSFQQQGTGAYTLTIREFAGPSATKDASPKSSGP